MVKLYSLQCRCVFQPKLQFTDKSGTVIYSQTLSFSSVDTPPINAYVKGKNSRKLCFLGAAIAVTWAIVLGIVWCRG